MPTVLGRGLANTFKNLALARTSAAYTAARRARGLHRPAPDLVARLYRGVATTTVRRCRCHIPAGIGREGPVKVDLGKVRRATTHGVCADKLPHLNNGLGGAHVLRLAGAVLVRFIEVVVGGDDDGESISCRVAVGELRCEGHQLCLAGADTLLAIVNVKDTAARLGRNAGHRILDGTELAGAVKVGGKYMEKVRADGRNLGDNHSHACTDDFQHRIVVIDIVDLDADHGRRALAAGRR